MWFLSTVLTRRTFTLFLSLVLLVGLVSVPAVQAETDTSHEMQENQNAEAQLTKNLETIDKALNQKAIQDRLKDLGYTPEEIQNRLDRLSPEEAQQLAERIESVETGGDLGGWTNSELLSVLLIVLIVVIIV